MNALTWINANWDSIVATLASIAGGARLIVKLAPEPKPGTAYEEVIEILKHIALSIPAPKDTVTTAVSNVAKDASKTATVAFLAIGLTLGGCTAAQLDKVVTVADKVTTSVNGLLTAANALWTQVGSTITTPQFESLLTSFGVKQSDLSGIESVVGLGNQAGAASVVVSANLVALLDKYNAQVNGASH